MSDSVIHIAGAQVQVGQQLRQRCSWCGAVLEDYDLTRIMSPANPDGSPPGPPPLWEVGALIAVDRSDGGSGAAQVVDHEDGAQLPAECCASLPHDVTGATG